MNKQSFLAAAMLTAVGMVLACSLYAVGLMRRDARWQRAGITAGALFLGASGLLMWYLARLAQAKQP
jgi:hypothetical protein